LGSLTHGAEEQDVPYTRVVEMQHVVFDPGLPANPCTFVVVSEPLIL
jgi:hypothetical protein